MRRSTRILVILLTASTVWPPAPARADEPEPAAPPALVAAEPEPPTGWRRPGLWVGLVSAGVIVGASLNSFLDDPRGGFRFADEGWFGKDTYAGGGDKASHFVSFAIMNPATPRGRRVTPLATDRGRA